MRTVLIDEKQLPFGTALPMHLVFLAAICRERYAILAVVSDIPNVAQTKKSKGVLSQLPFGFFINHNNIEKLLQPDLRPA